MENKIVFYGLQSSLVEISGNKLTGTVKFVLFETEKERDDAVTFINASNAEINIFDITQEIMDLFNLKTQREVMDKLRKEFEEARNKIGGVVNEM